MGTPRKKPKTELETIEAGTKTGRPSSYRVEYADQARKLCLLGYTDKELSEFFDVCEATINNWKKDYPAFLESIRAGKDIADAEVAHSLYRRATGEYVLVEKAFKGSDGTYEKMELRTYVEPDTQAARLWLLNRRSLSWKDKQELQHSGTVSVQFSTVYEQRPDG